MPTKLEALLEKIDYKNLIGASENELNRILSSYRREKNIVDNYEEFEECLIDFTSKLMNAFFHFTHPVEHPSSIMFTNALEYLKKEYPNNTKFTVYDIMHSGAEGGVYKILKVIKDQMIDDTFSKGINNFVNEYLRSLNYESRDAAVKEYLEKYSDILPQNYKDDPMSVLIHFDRVLIEHPRMVKRIRELNKSAKF